MPVKQNRLHHSGLPKHKHTKNYLQTYWPYLPMLLMVLVVTLFANPHHRQRLNNVQSYTVNASSSSLLDDTNTQRNSHKVSSLKINSKLTTAAQTKANDMVKKNYWSHVTPDGRQPWAFIQAAGYNYAKAGENLAYGFASSNDTVDGWMNSAPHRANLLDSSYSDVGFGIANSQNFNNSGPETVIVAMYGKPTVLGVSSKATAATPAAVSAKITPTVTASKVNIATKPEIKKNHPLSTASAVSQEPASIAITQAQEITNGNMPWLTFLIGLISGMGVIYLLLRHSLSLRHFTKRGKKMLTHHPLIDFGVFCVVLACYLLSQTSGIIR